MLNDAEWCWMMINDAEWCWMMLNDAKWCWMMLNDAEWCWMMLNDGEWCYMMLNDTEWCWMILRLSQSPFQMTSLYFARFRLGSSLKRTFPACFPPIHRCRNAPVTSLEHWLNSLSYDAVLFLLNFWKYTCIKRRQCL